MANVNKSFDMDGMNSGQSSISREKLSVHVDGGSRPNSSAVLRTTLGKILVVAAIVFFIVCVVLVVLLVKEKNEDDDENRCKTDEEIKGSSSSYSYSAEANRVGLQEFLKKVQTTYYQYHSYSLAWQSNKTSEEIAEDVKNRHLPYNNTPAYLKAKTDAALSLLKEIETKNIDDEKLKPRELKVVEQVKHFLKTVFGNVFDENFYNGDWMLGPNHFCWQAICSIAYHINAYAHHAKPGTLPELEDALKRIMLNRETILQYKSNMQLGVQTGMVRAKATCQSGLDAFKQEFKATANENKPDDVLKEWFVEKYIHQTFTEKISAAEKKKWLNKNKQNVSESVKDALIEGIGKPLVVLLNYIANDHLRHCLPQDHSSGIASLPVDYIYLDGKSTGNRTTKRLPITKQVLDGKKTYKNILVYFTTSDITPEKINEIGNKTLHVVYTQVLTIAKSITGDSNETSAVMKFRTLLSEQKQFYNNASFPEIESNGTAHKLCQDAESAKKHCPRRWAAVLIWADTCRKIMGTLAPKLTPLFYHTGGKITVPNCPIEMLPSYNPSSGAQYFWQSDSECKKPAYFGLPFFLENFGPRFSEWSGTAHEAWPGHHTQVQSQLEYFRDKYGGVPKWIDEQTYYTFFTEGWALYSENPVIAQDTDTYKNNLWQKYGMLKWQIWRALRLIVDTGLHYRGMNRSTALEYFSKYAWDDTDLARKEVTRYMGVPGQATAYMLGQQKLIQLRNYAKTELGKKFTIQNFHYQVLSQGSAPEAYLAKHVEKYVKCTQGKLKGEQCDVILKPPKRESSSRGKKESEGPPKPPRRHYI